MYQTWQSKAPPIQQTWQSKAPDCFRNPVFVAHDGERIVGFVEGRYSHGNEAHILEISEPVFIPGYEEKTYAKLLKMAFLAWVSTEFPDITHYRKNGFLTSVESISSIIPSNPQP